GVRLAQALLRFAARGILVLLLECEERGARRDLRAARGVERHERAREGRGDAHVFPFDIALHRRRSGVLAGAERERDGSQHQASRHLRPLFLIVIAARARSMRWSIAALVSSASVSDFASAGGISPLSTIAPPKMSGIATAPAHVPITCATGASTMRPSSCP